MDEDQETRLMWWERGSPRPPGEDPNRVLNQILAQLVRIGNIIEEDRAPRLGYRFDKISVLANQTNFEINLTPPARMMTVHADNPVTVRLHDRAADAIEVRGIDYPLMPPMLPASASVGKLYITTGTSATIVRILSFG